MNPPEGNKTLPSRILRDGYLKSRRVDALSDQAALFYTRLLLVVDDYGRIEFDPLALLSDTFPLRPGRYSVSDVTGWMRECTASSEDWGPLLKLYHCRSKAYIQVSDFRQRVRAASKCPPPPGITDPVFQKGKLLRPGSEEIEVAPPLFAAAAALPDNDGHCQTLSASRARTHTQSQPHSSSHTPPEDYAPPADAEVAAVPWPESAAVVQELHPGADNLPEIVKVATAICPEVTDPELADVLRITHQGRRQKSAGLWPLTVPAHLLGRPPRRAETARSNDISDRDTAAEIRACIKKNDEFFAEFKNHVQVEEWKASRRLLAQRLAELEATTEVNLANTG